jgi:hypothetical protein
MFYIIDLNTNSKVPNVEFQTYDDAMNWFLEYGNIVDYTIIEE